jgi:hypothetical protein
MWPQQSLEDTKLNISHFGLTRREQEAETWLSYIPPYRIVSCRSAVLRVHHIIAVSRTNSHCDFIWGVWRRWVLRYFSPKLAPVDKSAWRTASVINGRGKSTPSQRRFVNHKFPIKYYGIKRGPRDKLESDSFRYDLTLRIRNVYCQ